MGQVLAETFLRTALDNGAISFSEQKRILRSGRSSPYAFNSASFNNGKDLITLAQAYTCCILGLRVEFDILFGMAYKGIPIAACTAMNLWCAEKRWVACVHDRKEEKMHNEGGKLVGADMKGKKVILQDDAITVGGSCNAAAAMIREAGGELVGLVVGLDRQEQGLARNPSQSALQEFACKHQVPVAAVITLQQVIDALIAGKSNPEGLRRIIAYRAQYGARV